MPMTSGVFPKTRIPGSIETVGRAKTASTARHSATKLSRADVRAIRRLCYLLEAEHLSGHPPLSMVRAARRASFSRPPADTGDHAHAADDRSVAGRASRRLAAPLHDGAAVALRRPVRLDRGPNPSSGIAVEEEASYDPVRQVRTHRWRVRDTRSPAREIAPLRLRVIFPQELATLLEAEGFEVVHRFGDFAGNPLTPASLNQICVARAAAPRGGADA